MISPQRLRSSNAWVRRWVRSRCPTLTCRAAVHGRRSASLSADDHSGLSLTNRSPRFTRGRSLVRSQPRPFTTPALCGIRMVAWVTCVGMPGMPAACVPRCVLRTFARRDNTSRHLTLAQDGASVPPRASVSHEEVVAGREFHLYLGRGQQFCERPGKGWWTRRLCSDPLWWHGQAP